MSVTLELSPEQEAVLTSRARSRGVSLGQLLLDLAEQLEPGVSAAHMQRSNPAEWARRFDAWVDSHDRNTPVLSDEAMSRESIYPDRA
jgi:hypothetical protein